MSRFKGTPKGPFQIAGNYNWVYPIATREDCYQYLYWMSPAYQDNTPEVVSKLYHYYSLEDLQNYCRAQALIRQL